MEPCTYLRVARRFLTRIAIFIAVVTAGLGPDAAAQKRDIALPDDLTDWQRCLADLVIQGEYPTAIRISEMWDIPGDDPSTQTIVRDIGESFAGGMYEDKRSGTIFFNGAGNMNRFVAKEYLDGMVGKSITLDRIGGPLTGVVKSEGKRYHYLTASEWDHWGTEKELIVGIGFEDLPAAKQLELIDGYKGNFKIPKGLIGAIHFRAGNPEKATSLLEEDGGALAQIISKRQAELAAQPDAKYRPPRVLYTRAPRGREFFTKKLGLPQEMPGAIDRQLAIFAKRQAPTGYFVEFNDRNVQIVLGMLANGQFPGHGEHGPNVLRYVRQGILRNRKSDPFLSAMVMAEAAALSGDPIEIFHARCLLKRMLALQEPDGMFAKKPGETDIGYITPAVQTMYLCMMMDIESESCIAAMKKLRTHLRDPAAYDAEKQTFKTHFAYDKGDDDAQMIVILHLLGDPEHPHMKTAIERTLRAIQGSPASAQFLYSDAYGAFADATALYPKELAQAYHDRVVMSILTQRNKEGYISDSYDHSCRAVLDLSGYWRYDWKAVDAIAATLLK